MTLFHLLSVFCLCLPFLLVHTHAFLFVTPFLFWSVSAVLITPPPSLSLFATRDASHNPISSACRSLNPSLLCLFSEPSLFLFFHAAFYPALSRFCLILFSLLVRCVPVFQTASLCSSFCVFLATSPSPSPSKPLNLTVVARTPGVSSVSP